MVSGNTIGWLCSGWGNVLIRRLAGSIPALVKPVARPVVLAATLAGQAGMGRHAKHLLQEGVAREADTCHRISDLVRDARFLGMRDGVLVSRSRTSRTPFRPSLMRVWVRSLRACDARGRPCKCLSGVVCVPSQIRGALTCVGRHRALAVRDALSVRY